MSHAISLGSRGCRAKEIIGEIERVGGMGEREREKESRCCTCPVLCGSQEVEDGLRCCLLYQCVAQTGKTLQQTSSYEQSTAAVVYIQPAATASLLSSVGPIFDFLSLYLACYIEENRMRQTIWASSCYLPTCYLLPE